MNEEKTGKKTPLYQMHVKYGGKIVPFAGYLLPVQYKSGVIAEHMAVREACGLFDVSHMGEILCTGADSLKNIDYLLTNSFEGMKDGRARYGLMCNEEGGIIDDLIVYRISEGRYLIVVNASNKDKDYIWMQDHVFGDCRFKDISSSVAQLALQGPKAVDILRKITDESNIPEKYYTAVFDAKINGEDCIISRTGYTGEDGVEIYIAADKAPALWELLLESGEEEGIIPCGLGARDTLRLEAGMPLYGNDMDETVTPYEAGLGSYVKIDKEDFIGRAVLAGKDKPDRKRTGLKVTGRGIIREHEMVYSGDDVVGLTTSGTHAPYLGYPVAMALIDTHFTKPGTVLEADVRGRRVAAEVVPLPFYRRG